MPIRRPFAFRDDKMVKKIVAELREYYQERFRWKPNKNRGPAEVSPRDIMLQDVDMRLYKVNQYFVVRFNKDGSVKEIKELVTAFTDPISKKRRRTTRRLNPHKWPITWEDMEKITAAEDDD